jgi:hypothetical protein
MSTVTQDSGGPGSRPSSKDGNKKNIWSSMLDSVASGKRLPEKNMIVLGMFSARLGILVKTKANAVICRRHT